MISVILPTLNEKNIALISRKLSSITVVNDVIFVDDRSTDGTLNEIKKLKKKKFRGFLRKSKNRDLSKSVIYGANKARNKYIVVMDCDLQHDVNYIYKMWKKIKYSKSDIIIANRFKEKRYSGNLGFLRSILSNFAIGLINGIFGKKTSDPLSGFFLCKKELLTKYKNNYYLKGYKILFDLIYNGKENLKINEVDINFKKRSFEKSKFNFKVIWLFLGQNGLYKIC